jgi:hypothetical protein
MKLTGGRQTGFPTVRFHHLTAARDEQLEGVTWRCEGLDEDITVTVAALGRRQVPLPLAA